MKQISHIPTNTFQVGDRFENLIFDRQFIIVDMEYCNIRNTVRYSCQQQRFKFDMFHIEEETLKSNLADGSFKLKEQKEIYG